MLGNIRKRSNVTWRLVNPRAQPMAIGAPCEQKREYAAEARIASIWRFAVTFLTFFILALVAWASHASAQVLDLAPRSKVSVRELHIPRKAQEANRQGLERLNNHDPAGSLSHFNKALENFPSYYEAYYNRGLAEMQLEQNDEALQSFQRAIGLSGGRYVRASFGYGLALVRDGKAEEAELAVRRGLEQDPTIADGHVVLSIVLWKLHRVDEAEKRAHEALQLPDNDSRKAYLVLASIHDEREEYAAEAQDLDAYLKREFRDPNALFLQTALHAAQRLAQKNRPCTHDLQ